MFLLGAGVGYYVLSTGLQVLISFMPSSVVDLVEWSDRPSAPSDGRSSGCSTRRSHLRKPATTT
jgi:hypothetical protein